jgi:hypothetical protein
MSTNVLQDRWLKPSVLSDMRTFEMVKYMQELGKALFPSPDTKYWDADEALWRLASRGFRLSPKDHWENNGILEDLVKWSRASYPSSLLWIGGQSGNQDPWVTELSLDIVQALLPQPITVLYIFCSDAASALEEFTPAKLVKLLIMQLLRIHPQLAYENPMSFSVLRLQNASTFAALWRILEELTSDLTGVYIIIDRIEECMIDEDADLKTDLLPSLAQLVHSVAGSKAIVTSIYELPGEAFNDSLKGIVSGVFVDTRKTSTRSIKHK